RARVEAAPSSPRRHLHHTPPAGPLSRHGRLRLGFGIMRTGSRKPRKRFRRSEMPTRRELVVEQLHALADDLEELWKAATRDPAAERRKQRGWALLTGALGAAATIASRRALAKLWPILTGEPAPGMKAPGAPRERDRERVP